MEKEVCLRSELTRLYLEEKKSCKKIAEHFGVTAMIIHKYLKKFGIQTRTPAEANKLVDKTGKNNHMYGKHLSDETKRKKSEAMKAMIANRGQHWSKGRKISEEERKMRSISMSGAGNPRWLGGTRAKTDGYIEIYQPNHPYKNKGRNTVYEHRLVMEEHLGRYLLPHEIVHHINENKYDNRLENLLLLSNAEHMKLHSALKERHPRSYFCTPEVWQKTKYSCCKKCNTTTIRHRGHGLCAKCYVQEKRKNRLKSWKEGGFNAD